MANPTVFDSTLTNPGGTGTTITVTLPTHAAGDVIYICVGNTGNTLWTGNPAGWTRIQQVQIGTSANGLLGTWFWHKVISGDSLPLTNPTFTLGTTVSRMATARSIRGSDLESPFVLTEWSSRAYNTGTANPVRPTVIGTNAPEQLILHDYFSRAATNAPDPSGYTQDEEIVISGTLVGNSTEKVVADQATTISNQDASPTSGVRWVAGIIAVPSPDYAYYRAGSQALTASGTSATPTLPTGTSSSDNRGNKDLVIATIECAGTPTISPQVGGDWTQITGWNTTTSGDGTTVRKYWALYDGSINTQFNRNTTGEIFVYLSTYHNAKQSSPIGSLTVQQNTSNSTPPFPSITRSAAKSTVQITGITDAIPTWSSPAPWIERNDSNGVTCADQQFNSAGSVTSGNFSLSAAGPSATGTMEILSVSSVTEHTRSATVDGAGLVSTAASFFSIFARSSLLSVSASVSVSGVRQVSRSAAIAASGDVASSGIASTPSTTFERSVAVDCSAQIDSSATSFSVFDRIADIGFTGNIATSAVFFSEFSRSAAAQVTVAIDSSALFFSVFNGTLQVDAAVSISSSAEFLSVFSRTATVNVSGAIDASSTFLSTLSGAVHIDSVGTVEVSALFLSEFNRSITVQVSGAFESSGESLSVFERTVQIAATASLSSSAQFFTTIDRTILIDCAVSIDSSAVFLTISESSVSVQVTGSIQSAGEIQSGTGEHERSALITVVGALDSSGIFLTVSQGSAVLSAVASVNMAGQKESVRSASLNCVGLISVAGEVSGTQFYPRNRAIVREGERTLVVEAQNRTA